MVLSMKQCRGQIAKSNGRLGLMALVLVSACGKGSPGGASPRRSATCPEGQTGYVDVNNTTSKAVNVYSGPAGSGSFLGTVRGSSRSTFPLPRGVQSAYLGGATADQAVQVRDNNRVTLSYRCE